MTDTVAESTDDPETNRLRALTEFVKPFAPAIGEIHDPYAPSSEDDAPPAVLRARDGALVAAFDAIARIARIARES